MSSDPDIFSAAAELSASGCSFVLVTVIRTEGRTPRDAGAKMIWMPAGTPNGAASGVGDLIGTIGGGQFEHLVIDAAAQHLRRHTCGTERYVLGADADQCCGGVMEVFFESHGPTRRVVVFGAGHVSKELAPLLEGASLELVVVDDRAEWNSPERFLHARRILSWDEGVAIALQHPAATLVCVLTYSHDTDFELLRKLLLPPGPPAFTGLIGSRSKRACLFGRLVAAGRDETAVQRVYCPIGIGDTGKAPRLVAVSIAAQLLMEAGKLETL